jgi:hypothetical protein
MDESVSPVMFLYGMAVTLAVGKAFTLFIWRSLPKPRPPLRHEVMEAWRRRRRIQVEAGAKPVEPLPATEGVLNDNDGDSRSSSPERALGPNVS